MADEQSHKILKGQSVKYGQIFSLTLKKKLTSKESKETTVLALCQRWTVLIVV